MSGGIEYLDIGGGDTVIGVKATGTMSAAEMNELIEGIERIQSSGKKASIYVDLTGYEGYDLGVVKEKLGSMGTLWNGIERCAYVVDKSWMSTVIGLVDAVTPMHLRAFGSDKDAEARAWVTQK